MVSAMMRFNHMELTFAPGILTTEFRDQVRAFWNGDPAKTLHSIAQEKRAGSVRHVGQLSDVLDDADLIVHQHDGN